MVTARSQGGNGLSGGRCVRQRAGEVILDRRGRREVDFFLADQKQRQKSSNLDPLA